MIAKHSRAAALALVAVLSLVVGPALAQGRGGGGPHGGGGRPPGVGPPPGGGGHYYAGGGYRPYYPYWGGYRPYYPYGGGLALGIGIGVASSYYWAWPYYGGYYTAPYYAYPAVAPANTGYTLSTAPAAPASAPEPIYYPRSGQSDAQRETDLRECNRWATTQPPALADAQVFQRAVLACMDGRGYTGR